MQIKVIDTRMHQVTKQVMLGTQPTRIEEVSVAEAELVLTGSMKNDLHEVHLLQQQEWIKVLKPILISRKEKIEKGDYIFHFLTKEIMIWDGDEGVTGNPKTYGYIKILALPEHFSPKHLQAIVDGKMKEGDKVLVECGHQEEVREDTEQEVQPGASYFGSRLIEKAFYYIKFNSSNHITLYKKEEKMYPKSEIEELFHEFNQTGYSYKQRTYEETQQWLNEKLK